MEVTTVPAPQGFGRRVQVSRYELGLSRRQFARRVGVGQHTILLWETGATKRPGAEAVVRLAKVTGKPVEYFAEAIGP
jgi:transcriptional regulator with XRE-family HTH domain